MPLGVNSIEAIKAGLVEKDCPTSLLDVLPFIKLIRAVNV